MPYPTYSFEFFPPKTEAAEKAFWDGIPVLAALHPKFMTVTYGAGGSTRDKTLEVVAKLQAQTGIPVAAHLTYINTTRQDIFRVTDAMWKQGIRHIIALRGDLPKDLNWPLDPDADYFQHTSEFVEALKARHDFEISVGAYPEVHPDAGSLAADIEALKKKCDAGATRAITQFFFDNDCFYKFVDACQAAGINTPIIPGILPVHDIERVKVFAGRCAATVPDWLSAKFDGRTPEDARKVAEEVLAQQSFDLKAKGIQHIHYYTLNKPDITVQACEKLHA